MGISGTQEPPKEETETQGFSQEEEGTSTAHPVGISQEVPPEPELPPSQKELGFAKIEELLESGKITDTQAEQFFTQISSGEIETVMKQLQNI